MFKFNYTQVSALSTEQNGKTLIIPTICREGDAIASSSALANSRDPVFIHSCFAHFEVL